MGHTGTKPECDTMQAEKLSILLEIISFFLITTDLYGKERIVKLGTRLHQLFDRMRLFKFTQLIYRIASIALPDEDLDQKEVAHTLESNEKNSQSGRYSLFLLSVLYLGLFVFSFRISRLAGQSLIESSLAAIIGAFVLMGMVVMTIHYSWLIFGAIIGNKNKQNLEKTIKKFNPFSTLKNLFEDKFLVPLSFDEQPLKETPPRKIEQWLIYIFYTPFVLLFAFGTYSSFVLLHQGIENVIVRLLVALLISSLGTGFILFFTLIPLMLMVPLLEIILDIVLGVTLFLLDTLNMEGLLLIAGTIIFLLSKMILFFQF